jgi:hypothetical protein
MMCTTRPSFLPEKFQTRELLNEIHFPPYNRHLTGRAPIVWAMILHQDLIELEFTSVYKFDSVLRQYVVLEKITYKRLSF